MSFVDSLGPVLETCRQFIRAEWRTLNLCVICVEKEERIAHAHLESAKRVRSDMHAVWISASEIQYFQQVPIRPDPVTEDMRLELWSWALSFSDFSSGQEACQSTGRSKPV
ncbi:hypothetical protein R1flu_020757 [Riccia fluitans]|uniref:Uncharacterized protein n=1 Tax=Riccia fluitans TaxID=41844 RepID=A0ABD1ZQV5_9MARC